MYRKTSKYRVLCEKMRAAKEKRRLENPLINRSAILPELRRKIIIEDYDSGITITHELLLYKTNRVDCYRVISDGKEWKSKIGWSGVLAGIRKALPRVCISY